MKILHIDSSILGDASNTRVLSANIVARLRALHPDAEVVHRDLAAEPPPHLTAAQVAVTHGGAEPGDDDLRDQMTSVGRYVDELLAADAIVIGVPMYNFAIPSQLKAWIDRITIPRRSFHYGEAGPEGLVKGKRVFLASAQGGMYTEGPMAAFEHQESYMRAILAFLGMDDVTVVRGAGMKLDPETKARNLEAANEAIARIAA